MQVQAAERLGLSVRQVRRLLVRRAVVGMEGLLPRPRGGNRAMDPASRDQILSLITAQYHDFGPTLVAEKLQALHTISICQTIDGKMIISYKNQKLNYVAAPKKTTPIIASRKEVHQLLHNITTTNRFLPTSPQPPQQRAS